MQLLIIALAFQPKLLRKQGCSLDFLEVKLLDLRLGKEFPLPKYASQEAAGLDLIVCNQSDVIIEPKQTLLTPTGIAIHINNPGYCAVILPRSGLGHKHGLILGNSVGLIDSDYQGQLMVSCWNRSTTAFTLTPGMRFAQLVVLATFRPKINIVSEFEHQSIRAEQGFGSSGNH